LAELNCALRFRGDYNMKLKFLCLIIISTLVLTSCNKGYNGPYSDTPLLTKEVVKQKISTDTALIKNSSTPLIKQVQAKQDIKFYQMILASYVFYEGKIKDVDGKQYTITADAINQFIKDNKYEANLKMIESDSYKWPAIFIGNLARYFSSIGFVVYVDPTNKVENIVINW
jgi:hypothetical protein